MATFSYRAKDTGGEVISGIIEADNESAVVTRLQSMGYFPLAVQSEKKGDLSAALGLPGLFGRGRVKTADLATFNRQMSDLISSGIPLVKALEVVGSQTVNPTLTKTIEMIANDVSSGDTLAEALGKHPRFFNALTVAMVRAGETGGMLESVLQRLADFAENEEETRSKIKSALAYPAVMVVVGAGAIAVLITVVIPKIVGIFRDMDQVLPLPTRILLGATGFMSEWWLVILGAIVGGVFACWRFSKTENGARLIHGLMLSIPVYGEVILKREVGQFARTLGELVRNGVPILSAFEIAQRVLTNRIIADEVAQVPEALTEGGGIAESLKGSKHFPPVVINMVSIGEETGNLPSALLKVASSYEKQVDRAVKTMTSLLEPLIILAMGIVVGAIVISMLLPIFTLDPTGGM